MTVYVDDAAIRRTVHRYKDRLWFHMFADSREELHQFAGQLGLRRSWFQDPCAPTWKPFPARTGSFAAETWHYDITKSVRDAAINLGAKPVTTAQGRAIMRARLNKPASEPTQGDLLA